MESKEDDKGGSRKRRLPDASKHPDTVTTYESIVTLLKDKHESIFIDNGSIDKMRRGVEKFAQILALHVIQSRANAKPQAKSGKTRSVQSQAVPRVSTDEIWRALVTVPSLRPIAIRFMSFGLIPPEYKDLFDASLAVNVDSLSEEDDMYSDSSEINSFLLEPDALTSSGNHLENHDS